MMRYPKTLIWVLVLGWLSFSLASAQSAKQASKLEAKPEVKAEFQKETPPPANYDPAGRRDPFKDLLGGKEIKEKTVSGGLADMAIDDISLIGVVKMKGIYEAIISVTEGFPISIKEGDKFSDGYVLSVAATQVVFRKTKDRGVPLSKPKDIIKEISTEEL
jgi:Tfp pilus assembly protein PilP